MQALDRDGVIDLAIEVCAELPPVLDRIRYFESAAGSPIGDVTKAERVCASGAMKVAIHRLTGLTDNSDLDAAEDALLGTHAYLHPSLHSVELRAIVADRVGALTTIKESYR